MAKIRNVSGDDRVVPWLNNRTIGAGELADVPAEDVYAYTQQAGVWEPGDKEAQGIHDAARKAAREAAAEAASDPAPPPDPAPSGPPPRGGDSSQGNSSDGNGRADR